MFLMFLVPTVTLAVVSGILFLFVISPKRGETKPEAPSVTIDNAVFSVEVVRTAEEQMRGLGYRDTLCENCGMLFLFDRPEKIGFWMKEMRFPIDILWIRDGTIVHIERAVSHTDQQTVYTPQEPADSVFEINAGMSDRHRIHVGSTVSFRGM